ncbi:hypothetical protein AOLI_G00143310 [Acnodon oligacanthus]
MRSRVGEAEEREEQPGSPLGHHFANKNRKETRPRSALHPNSFRNHPEPEPAPSRSCPTAHESLAGVKTTTEPRAARPNLAKAAERSKSHQSIPALYSNSDRPRGRSGDNCITASHNSTKVENPKVRTAGKGFFSRTDVSQILRLSTTEQSAAQQQRVEEQELAGKPGLEPHGRPGSDRACLSRLNQKCGTAVSTSFRSHDARSLDAGGGH